MKTVQFGITVLRIIPTKKKGTYEVVYMAELHSHHFVKGTLISHTSNATDILQIIKHELSNYISYDL